MQDTAKSDPVMGRTPGSQTPLYAGQSIIKPCDRQDTPGSDSNPLYAGHSIVKPCDREDTGDTGECMQDKAWSYPAVDRPPGSQTPLYAGPNIVRPLDRPLSQTPLYAEHIIVRPCYRQDTGTGS